MKENEFILALNEKLRSLVSQREKIMADLLNGNWHAAVVERSLQASLDNLEKNDPDDLPRELVGIIEQVPALIRNVWTSTLNNAKVYEQEIARWQEMQQYYVNFLENQQQVIKLKKDVEEEDKNEVENSVPVVEEARETLKSGIVSGDIKEPSKMQSIRRWIGTHPGPTLSDYRNIKRDLEDEQTTAEDDSAR
jgi:hypothetical protein